MTTTSLETRKYKTEREFLDKDSIFDRKVLITKEMFEDLYELREFCSLESETENETVSNQFTNYMTTLDRILRHTQSVDYLHSRYVGHIFPIWLHPEFKMDSEFGEKLRTNVKGGKSPQGVKELGEITKKF